MDSTVDRAGRTDLHYAAADGDVARVQQLITSGADVHLADRAGFTPLHFAAQEQHEQVARILIRSGAPVDATDAYGSTPLLVALFNVRDRDGAVIRVLLDAGANPDAENHHGVSARGLVATVANYDLSRFFK